MHERNIQQNKFYSLPEINVKDALNDSKILSEEIEKILRINTQQAKKQLNQTSPTAFRKIHGFVSSAIDEAVVRSDTSRALVKFTKALIMVEYQEARGQLDHWLADIVARTLQLLIADAKNNSSIDRKKLDRARALIDSLAVLSYRLR